MIDAELFKDYLLEKGIPAVVKGAMLTGIIGEIPVNTFPTVWIDDDRDFDIARQYVEKYERQIKENGNDDSWCCTGCGEENEPQFLLCWSCGEEKTVSNN